MKCLGGECFVEIEYCGTQDDKISFCYNAVSLVDSMFLGKDLICLSHSSGAADQYGVYRVTDGSLFCTINTKDLIFLRTSSLPIRLSPLVTKVLDIKTNKIYEVNCRTLIHLGG